MSPPAPQPAQDPSTIAAAVAAAASGAVIAPPAIKRKPAVPAALASALGATAKPVAQPIAGPDNTPGKSMRPPLNAKNMLFATAALIVVLGGALTLIPLLFQDDTAESPSVDAEIALDISPARVAPLETALADNPAPAESSTTLANGQTALQDSVDPVLIASLPAPRLLEVEPTEPESTAETLPDPVTPAENLPSEHTTIADTPIKDTPVEATLAPQVLSQAAQYAATGIWKVAPEISDLPKLVNLDSMQVPQIDRGAPVLAVGALTQPPATTSFDTDQDLAGVATGSAVEPSRIGTPQITATEPAQGGAELVADTDVVEDATAELALSEGPPVAPPVERPIQLPLAPPVERPVERAEERPVPRAVPNTEREVEQAEVPDQEIAETAENTEPTATPAPPAPARDARGLIIATAEGVLAPEGFMIYQGRPDIVPPAVPDRLDAEDLAAQRAAQAAEELRRELGRVRPRMRPASLTRFTEEVDAPEDEPGADIAAATEAALASPANSDSTTVDTAEAAEATPTAAVEDTVAPTPRPRLRPRGLTTLAGAVAEANTGPETGATLRPRARPTNFEALLRRSREQATVRNTRAASVEPTIPSSASVARQATQNDVLNLRRLNLIGVYGTTSNRRALVRLPSGRYVKVKVGDRIDGGRVVAIGQDQLRYQKGSRSETLRMPRS